MIIRFLTVDQVIEIHNTFLDLYGGLSGIRDHGLLASAVEMPRLKILGEEVHKTLYDKAAAYLYHIVKNHPFNNGNKRTGAGVALMFLRVNGIELLYKNETYVQIVIDVANDKVEKSDISHFFQKFSEQN